MSETRNKCGLHAPLPNTEDLATTELYNYLRSLFGKADDIIRALDSDEVEEFYYDEKPESFRPFADLNGQWGVEWTFSVEDEYYPEYNLTMNEINEIVNNFSKFGIDPKTVTFFCYTWDTGVDEPKEFLS